LFLSVRKKGRGRNTNNKPPEQIDKKKMSKMLKTGVKGGQTLKTILCVCNELWGREFTEGRKKGKTTAGRENGKIERFQGGGPVVGKKKKKGGGGGGVITKLRPMGGGVRSQL